MRENQRELASALAPLIYLSLNGYFQAFREDLISRKRVRELLFEGYHVNMLDPIDRLSQPLAQIGIHVPKGQLVNNSYGLLYGRNNTAEGPFVALTGIGVPSELVGHIVSWNGHEFLPFWRDRTCNAINGSDGSLFGPSIKKRDVLYAFTPEGCR